MKKEQEVIAAKVDVHRFNLNELSDQREYNRLIVELPNILGFIDKETGSKWKEDSERGEITISDLFKILKFGEYKFLKFIDGNAYIIPFNLVGGKVREDDKTGVKYYSYYLLYNITPETEIVKEEFFDMLYSIHYIIKGNLQKIEIDEVNARFESGQSTILKASNGGDDFYKVVNK